MKITIILFIILWSPIKVCSQQANFNWCFGDSSGMDFNSISNPQPINSGLRTRGSCASISDSSGNLLMYAFTRATVPGNTTKVFNNQHQLMQNGDNIVGSGWYHEIVIVPKPDNDSICFIFSAGVTNLYGLFYSFVNINANNGLGEIIQKNVILNLDEQVDCINAVKHGNGRDWWVVGRRTTVLQNGQYNNEYWTILVDQNGVGVPTYQNIGEINRSNLAKISFSSSGDSLLFTNANDVIEYLEFDRCTGLLTNPVTIRPPANVYSELTWGNEFSSDGRFIYTSTSRDTTQLFQYDLQSTNPLASRITLFQSTFPQYAGGDVKRGPDGKIYFSIAYVNTGVSYPYPDSVYNSYNMNLSVINSPDSLGAACDFQPYSFYLGGKRTYYGLPNNPDYFLGPKIGSPCDTITAISETSQQALISNIFPNPSSGQLTINYFMPNGKQGKMEVFNTMGGIVYEKVLPRFTYSQNVDLGRLPSGIYLLKIWSGDKYDFKKWVKE